MTSLQETQESQEYTILSHVPKVVFVDFQTDKWQLKGLPVGVYPIFQTQRTWFIDSYRKKPVLGVKRTQIPLAPAFASTAHAAQGQTLQQLLRICN